MTFGVYSLMHTDNPDERLTANKAFVALSLFNILRFPLTSIPNIVSQLVQVGKRGEREALGSAHDEIWDVSVVVVVAAGFRYLCQSRD